MSSTFCTMLVWSVRAYLTSVEHSASYPLYSKKAYFTAASSF